MLNAAAINQPVNPVTVMPVTTVVTTNRTTDIGLLILRVGVSLSLFLKHGLEKLTGYSRMVQHFPDPIHIGAQASLAYALVTDGICTLLIALGLFTRPASALLVINLLTAFFFVHHAAFFKDGHVELVAVYIILFVGILVSGPGRFSLDARIKK
jgi:putative oxidoreductase